MKELKDLIVEELKNSNELRLKHLQDAVRSFFLGDKKLCLLMFRNLVNASCGFTALSAAVHIPSKSLMRMLSTAGNPTTDNLLKIITFLLRQENVDVKLDKLRKTA